MRWWRRRRARRRLIEVALAWRDLPYCDYWGGPKYAALRNAVDELKDSK